MDRVILMPVYNDWRSATMLIERLDAVLTAEDFTADILLVDDGSLEAPPAVLEGNLRSIRRVGVLALRRNLGHQRAIAVGLAYVAENLQCNQLVVMDSDGEDAPEDVPTLIKELNAAPSARIIFAERLRRSESMIFKFCYMIYRNLHHILTGEKVRFGNFSIVPGELLARVVSVSEIWNHYVAGVIVARLPYAAIPTARAKRLSGKSQMNFQSLIIHGLRALSVFSDTVAIRLLACAAVVSTITVIGVAAAIFIRAGSHMTFPDWVWNVIGLAIVCLLQTATLLVLFLFTVLSSRSMLGMMPLRDYQYFVRDLRWIYQNQNGQSPSTATHASADAAIPAPPATP